MAIGLAVPADGVRVLESIRGVFVHHIASGALESRLSTWFAKPHRFLATGSCLVAELAKVQIRTSIIEHRVSKYRQIVM